MEPERNTTRYYDLVCVQCGWRKMVDTFKNPFGKLLRKKVLFNEVTTYFWVDRPHIGRRTLLERSGEDWRIVFEYNIPDGRKAVEA